MEKESATTPTIESAMLLRFLPFPAVPDGAEVLFHSFRPSGIRVPINDDDDEVGALGGVRRYQEEYLRSVSYPPPPCYVLLFPALNYGIRMWHL